MLEKETSGTPADCTQPPQSPGAAPGGPFSQGHPLDAPESVRHVASIHPSIPHCCNQEVKFAQYVNQHGESSVATE